MTAPKEVELKLELPPASLPNLAKIPLIRALEQPPEQATEVSVYFDTDTHKLRKHGVLLRVRRVGDRYIQTIKATGNGALLARDEWESEIAGEMPDLDLARGTALEPLLSDKLRRGLKPLFETRVRRTIYPIADDKGARLSGRSIGERLIPATARHRSASSIADVFNLACELTLALPARLAA